LILANEAAEIFDSSCRSRQVACCRIYPVRSTETRARGSEISLGPVG
jgi:hypothetical protein